MMNAQRERKLKEVAIPSYIRMQTRGKGSICSKDLQMPFMDGSVTRRTRALSPALAGVVRCRKRI